MDPDDLLIFHRRDGTTFTDQAEAARLWMDIAYRRVALTWGPPGRGVSTVFLVFAHPPFEPHPMLYETLADGEVVERYPNEVAALAGHDRWVAAMLSKS